MSGPLKVEAEEATPTTGERRIPNAVPSDSHERVVSSVRVSRESRTRDTDADVLTDCLDRLLVAVCDMPIARGETAVVEFMVRSLGEMFPDYGIGACVVPPAPVSTLSQPDVSAREPAEQQLFKYVPRGEERRGVGMDPTRLFPGYRFERVLDVDEGSTLHLAGDDPTLDDDESATMHVVRRAAHALRPGRDAPRAAIRKPLTGREGRE